MRQPGCGAGDGEMPENLVSDLVIVARGLSPRSARFRQGQKKRMAMSYADRRAEIFIID